MQRATSHVRTHPHLCSDRFTVICFHKCSHHCFFHIYGFCLNCHLTQIYKYCQQRLVLSCHKTHPMRYQNICKLEDHECNCDSITMLMSDSLCSEVGRDSLIPFVLVCRFQETTFEHHWGIFFTNSPSLYGFLACAMFQASWYDASVTVSECFVHFWNNFVCFFAINLCLQSSVPFGNSWSMLAWSEGVWWRNSYVATF